MVIRLGNNPNPGNLYVGNQTVSRIYKGNQQVWPTTVSSGASADMVILSRSATGVAPDAVELEIQNISGFTSADRNLDYHWDMGEAQTFSAPSGEILPTYLDDNVRFGQRVCRTYRSVGSRTPSCTIYDPASGQTLVVTLASPIVTTDPDTYFSGAQTVYLDPAGSHPSAPAGATLVTSGDISAAVSTYIEAAGQPIRLMFARGENYTWAGSGLLGLNSTIDTFHIVAAPGGGAKPSISVTGSTFWVDRAVTNGGGSGNNKDVVLQNIEMVGGYNSATDAGTQISFFTWDESSPNLVLSDGVSISGAGNFMSQSSSINYAHRNRVFNDCDMVGLYSYAVFASNGRADWFTGCDFSADVNALADATNSGGGIYRSENDHAFTGVHATRSFNRQGWVPFGAVVGIMPSWRINVTGQNNSSAQFTCSSIEGGYTPIEFNTNAGETAGENCRCVIDKCYVLGGYMTVHFIGCNMPITVKNCIFVRPNVSQLTDIPIGLVSFIEIRGSDTTATTRNDTWEAYNNTAINELGGSSVSFVNDGATVGTLEVENNLVHQPNAGSSVAGGFSDSDRVMTPREIGYRDSTFTLGDEGDKSTPASFGTIPLPVIPQAIAATTFSRLDFSARIRSDGLQERGAVQAPV